jgi:hypothetical protein
MYCFEIFVHRPTNFRERASTFSSYKNNNTIKFLISITSQGNVSFISLGYGGRCSDKFIVVYSGLTPAFKRKRSHLSQLEVKESQVRIHVERVIGTLKVFFSVLSGPLHHEMLFTDEEEISFVNKIVKVACALNY